MTAEHQREFDAALARLARAAERAEAINLQAEAAAELFNKVITRLASSPMAMAVLKEAMFEAVYAAQSPWVPRPVAHLWWGGSASGMDTAVQMGVLTALHRGNGVVFEKAEGDRKIREGEWHPYDAKVRAARANGQDQKRKAA